MTAGSMSGVHFVHFAVDLNQKVSHSVSILSTSFDRALLELYRYELPSAVKSFFKFNSCQMECYLEAKDLHRALDLNSIQMDSYHSRLISNER